MANENPNFIREIVGELMLDHKRRVEGIDKRGRRYARISCSIKLATDKKNKDGYELYEFHDCMIDKSVWDRLVEAKVNSECTLVVKGDLYRKLKKFTKRYFGTDEEYDECVVWVHDTDAFLEAKDGTNTIARRMKEHESTLPPFHEIPTSNKPMEKKSIGAE